MIDPHHIPVGYWDEDAQEERRIAYRAEEILADGTRLHDAIDELGNWREYDQLISKIGIAKPGELNQAATYLKSYLERIAVEAAKAKGEK